MEEIHRKFQEVIAYLIFKKNWTWLSFLISTLCEIEMNFIILLDKERREFLEEDLISYIPRNTLYCEECPYKEKSVIAEFFYGQQSSGYCYFLRKGDFSFYGATQILWDDCKECGVGEEFNFDNW